MDAAIDQLLALHHSQLAASGLPAVKWRSLLYKLQSGIFDAGETFALEYIEEEEEEEEEDNADNDANDNDNEKQAPSSSSSPAANLPSKKDMKVVVVKEDGVQQDDPSAVWLVDHAWTFLASQQPTAQLRRQPALLQRMRNLVLREPPDEGDDGDAEEVMRALWPYANTYRLTGKVPNYPANESIWYIQDEFGSRIRHGPERERRIQLTKEGEKAKEDDDSPTLAMQPFFYQPEGCMYSVLWPLRNIEYGEEATRDYLPHEKDAYLRQGKLVAFYPHLPLPSEEETVALEVQTTTKWYSRTGDRDVTIATHPLAHFSQLQGDHAGPPGAELDHPWDYPGDRPTLRVYTDLQVIHETLTDPHFEVVGPDDAGIVDVWWATAHIKSFRDFVQAYPHALVGQLPNQKYLVCKDLLIETCYRGERTKDHLPLSYNLEVSLHAFIREYRRRAGSLKEGGGEGKGREDNVWIVKPWNMGRSLGVVVTDNLPHILRLMETGPKVVCKYITNPVTLRGYKFDLRFYLMIKHGAPQPEAYIHRRVVGRMANMTYALDDFENFQKHCTVFHYRAELETKHSMTYPEFHEAFDQEHGRGSFEAVRTATHCLATDLIHAASSSPSHEEEEELGHFKRGRALLGLDIMLEKQEGDGVMKPLLLEVTYMPDCRRILREYPDFMNDVFKTLVLEGKVPEKEVMRIL